MTCCLSFVLFSFFFIFCLCLSISFSSVVDLSVWLNFCYSANNSSSFGYGFETVCYSCRSIDFAFIYHFRHYVRQFVWLLW